MPVYKKKTQLKKDSDGKLVPTDTYLPENSAPYGGYGFRFSDPNK